MKVNKNDIWFVTKQALDKVALEKNMRIVLLYFDENESYNSASFRTFWMNNGGISDDASRNFILSKLLGLVYQKDHKSHGKVTPAGKEGIKLLKNEGDFSLFIEKQKTKIVLNTQTSRRASELRAKEELHNIIPYFAIIEFLLLADLHSIEVSVDDYKRFISIIPNHDSVSKVFDEYLKYKKGEEFSLDYWDKKDFESKISNIRHHKLWEKSKSLAFSLEEDVFQLKEVESSKKIIEYFKSNDDIFEDRIDHLYGIKSGVEFGVFNPEEHFSKENNKIEKIVWVDDESLEEWKLEKRKFRGHTNEVRSDEDEKSRNISKIVNSREFEDYVFKLLCKEDDEHIYEKTYLKNTNAGYDIAKLKNGSVISMYEVKKTNKMDFLMSKKEIEIADENPSNYFIVIEGGDGSILVVSWKSLKKSLEFIPMSYQVSYREKE